MSATPRSDEQYFSWNDEAGQALLKMYELSCQIERELNAMSICAGVASKERGEWADEKSQLESKLEAWEELWKAIKEMEPKLGDANKPLAIAASYALSAEELERLRTENAVLKQKLNVRNAAKANPTKRTHG